MQSGGYLCTNSFRVHWTSDFCRLFPFAELSARLSATLASSAGLDRAVCQLRLEAPGPWTYAGRAWPGRAGPRLQTSFLQSLIDFQCPATITALGRSAGQPRRQPCCGTHTPVLQYDHSSPQPRPPTGHGAIQTDGGEMKGRGENYYEN